MKKVPVTPAKEIKIENIAGFFKKVVKPFGTGAKIDCPKEYLGKEVYIVILDHAN